MFALKSSDEIFCNLGAGILAGCNTFIYALPSFVIFCITKYQGKSISVEPIAMIITGFVSGDALIIGAILDAAKKIAAMKIPAINLGSGDIDIQVVIISNRVILTIVLTDLSFFFKYRNTIDANPSKNKIES
jgi:hypothetical protein